MADFLDASDPNSINSESDIENHWIFRIFVDHSIFRNKEVFKKIKNIHAGHSDKMQTYRYDDIRDKYYLIISGHPKGEEVSKECA
ncbi:MAG: hypothetical protein O9308_14350 [Beijerinckiaceae bacterium]|nr:hypothetical protein [Beijerinckiaceae bacterium]